mmetsp:Transcript_23405/g.53330  ORF Transcript_23405/g.53330 Transcript_23405/m.53330 type:complete len:750 (-) Transcript_23405:282-2531(-)
MASQDKPESSSARPPTTAELQRQMRLAERLLEEQKGFAPAPRKGKDPDTASTSASLDSEMLRATARAKLDKTVDLAFLVDVTGSARNFIDVARKQMREIVHNVRSMVAPLGTVRVGMVGFRDFCDGDRRIEPFQFTSDVGEFENFLGRVKCDGGGDACEDVVGGLEALQALTWTSKIKIAYLITHTPPHGKRFYLDTQNSGSNWDKFPDIPSQHGAADSALQHLVKNEIQLVCVKVETGTERMFEVFREVYDKNTMGMKMSEVDLSQNCTAFCAAVTKTTWTSIRSSVLRWHTGSRVRGESSGGTGALPTVPRSARQSLDEVEAAWECELWEEFTANCRVYTLRCLPASDEKPDAHLYRRQETLNVRLGKEPFDQGAMRVAYPAYIADRDNQQVLAKQPLITSAAPGRSCYDILYRDVLSQSIARHFAEKFTKACPEFPVQFLRTELAERLDRPGQWYVIEPFMRGEFQKHTNNASFASKDSEVAQAFSHFTFHLSGGRMMVTDIQGVHSTMTDPQIHSREDCFGLGNRGEDGMTEFFQIHQCSSICHRLKLRPHPAQFQPQCIAGSVHDWLRDSGAASGRAVDQEIEIDTTLAGGAIFKWRPDPGADFELRLCTFSAEVVAATITANRFEVESLERDAQFTVWLRTIKDGKPSAPVGRSFSNCAPVAREEPMLMCDCCGAFLGAQEVFRGELDTAAVLCRGCEARRKAAMKEGVCEACSGILRFSEFEVKELGVDPPRFCDGCQGGMY